jgi:hypothetical protein
VALVDVVRAAIAETEDLDRVVFAVDERLAVFGNAVADLTHLVAELVENAVHFSPPEASVVIRTRPFLQTPGAHVLTVEDWGVGIRPEDMAAANDLLAVPREVDLSVSQRLGLHVVARLAKRHGIEVSLTPTPGCGVTAAVVLPPSLFADPELGPEELIADEADVTAEVMPVALPASVAAAPAGEPPVPPAPAGWSRAERWIDLTDSPAPDGNGNGHGDGPPPAPDGDDADWSGWWEPSPGDLEHGEPVSPLAARPPLSERAQPPSQRVPNPYPPGTPDPRPPGTPDPRPPGTPDPHPPVAGAPEREGSPPAAGVGAAVHSPRTSSPPQPAPVAVGEAAEGMLLARRVPQAHLAPELRRNRRGAPAAESGRPVPDADDARAALSRYQASRQAARAVVDEGGAGEAGPEGPPGNGGWS